MRVNGEAHRGVYVGCGILVRIEPNMSLCIYSFIAVRASKYAYANQPQSNLCVLNLSYEGLVLVSNSKLIKIIDCSAFLLN